jgi:hypothetical protein
MHPVLISGDHGDSTVPAFAFAVYFATAWFLFVIILQVPLQVLRDLV